MRRAAVWSPRGTGADLSRASATVRTATAMSDCTKVPLRTPADAEKALAIVARKKRRAGGKAPTGHYWCATCHAWHLTSTGPSRPAP